MPEYLDSNEDEEGVTTDEDTYDEELTVEEITNNTNNQNNTNKADPYCMVRVCFIV